MSISNPEEEAIDAPISNIVVSGTVTPWNDNVTVRLTKKITEQIVAEEMATVSDNQFFRTLAAPSGGWPVADDRLRAFRNADTSDYDQIGISVVE